MPINLLPKKFQEKERKEIRKKKKVAKGVEMHVPDNKPKTDENKKSKGNLFSNFFYPLFFRGKKTSNKIDDKEKRKLLEEKKRKEITDFLKDKKNIEPNHKKGNTKTYISESDADNKKKVFVDKKKENINIEKEKDNIKKQSFWQWFSGKNQTTDFQESKISSNDIDKIKEEYSAKNIKKSSEEKSFWQKGKIKEEKSFLNKNDQMSQKSKKKGEKNIDKKNKDTDKKGSFWQRFFFNIGENGKKNIHIAHKSKIIEKNKDNNKKKKKIGGSNKNNKKNRIKRFFQKKTEINFIDGELIGSMKLKIKERALSIIFVLFFSLIIIFSIYMLINWYQLMVIERSNEVGKKLQNLKNDIDIYEKKKEDASNFQKKLEAVDYLLSQHICWTDFFDGLEEITLKDVYYENINVDNNGNVSISAETNSFKTVAEQLLVFQNNEDLVETVKIDSADLTIEGDDNNEICIVRFDIILKINEDTFFYKEK